MRGEDRERKAPLQQCPAHDRTLAAGRRDRREIGPRSYASRGEHRQPRALPHPSEQVEIRSSEGSVAVNGRTDETHHTRCRAALRRLRSGHAGPSAPAVGKDMSGTDVYGDDETVGEPPGVVGKRAWLPERPRPDDDAGRAGLEELLRVLGRAHAPRGLDASRRRGAGEAPDELGARTARSRAVEIDDVHQPRAGADESFDKRDWISLARDDAAELATFEPHGLLAEQVDRGNDLEAVSILVLTC